MSVHRPVRTDRLASRDSVAYAMFIEGYRARMADVDAAVAFPDRDAFDDSLFARFQQSYHEMVTGSPTLAGSNPTSTTRATLLQPVGGRDPSTRAPESS